MIKYKITVGEVTTELECQTIGELIEYLNYDKEVAAEAGFTVNIPDDIPMYDSKERVWKGSWSPANFTINLEETKSDIVFVRPDGSTHCPKTETINGEEWYVNDGQQPVGNGAKVDVLFKKKQECHCRGAEEWKYGEDGEGTITHWRLAK